MRSLRPPSRRRFLAGTAAVAALCPSVARAAANERLTIAFIGIGTRARGVLGQCLRQGDTQVVAVCENSITR